MLDNFKLATKFTLLLSLVFIGSILFSGFALSQALEQKAKDEINYQGQILIEMVNSVRSYNDNHLNNLLEPNLKNQARFVPETIPTFAAREVFETLRKSKEYSNFLYKDATLNPTNLRDKADDFETHLIERLLNDGFRDLSRRLKLDYLFIDTHPGINEETLLSIIISHILVVVLRPDSQDYQGTAVAIDVARKLDVPNIMLVVNKALPTLNFAALRQQVASTYSTTVAGILPVCEEMFHLGSSDIFALRYPDHPWTQQVSAIAKQIMHNR
ncbi:MAG: DUF3365 domain-containing protein [Stigonema ocellatum SAG 48.90 = DSM 106950]|nr:DUF3365 domain-containing protein [Stigonema ocellatum SAG 48.90 = DSM 106950]